jgi:hypothetical protein
MGPAFATPVAPKAIADRAITEAIVVVELIFISRSPLTWMPTLNMEIGDRGSDYKECNFRYLTRTNGGARDRSADAERLGWRLLDFKEDFNGTIEIVSYLLVKGSTTVYTKDTIMKLTTIVLATAFALSGTAAFANTVHHKAAVRVDRHAVGMVQLHPNYGNPNGNPDGPTTLSGTGDSSFGGSSPGTSGYN